MYATPDTSITSWMPNTVPSGPKRSCPTGMATNEPSAS